MRSIRLIAVLLVFGAMLVLPTAGSARPLAKPESPSTPAPKDGAALRSFLASLWHVAAEIGCKIDPLGGCIQGVKPSSDIGCKIDPLGSDCLPEQQ